MVRVVFDISDELYEKIEPLIKNKKNLGYFASVALDERIKRIEARDLRAERQKAGTGR